jgi:multimeric flavodoxin WrbA
MKRLLIVYHTQFGNTAQLAEAALAGARTVPEVDAILLRAADAGTADLVAADALVLATSENFGGMAGMTKDFLERVYYPCGDRLAGRAYAALVCAGNDGTGAMRDIDRVARGLALRKVHPGLIHRTGTVAVPVRVPTAVLDEAAAIAATIAEGLVAGIY